MKQISVAIVGNCQARPLAQAIQTLLPDVCISGIAIVHLLRDSDEPSYAPIFQTADLILAQRVTDEYPCRFVRNFDLREKYGTRVLTWPNLFYSGYNPELTYFRDEKRRALGGPLGDYHNKTVLDAWRRGMTVTDALKMHRDEDYNQQSYGLVPSRSLDELIKRESETDIRIVDWIIERMWQQRLFFTFNHPKRALIEELAIRLMRTANLKFENSGKGLRNQTEPLGHISCPTNPWVSRHFNCALDEPREYQGVGVLKNEAGKVMAGKRCIYQEQQLIEEYFKVYDWCGVQKDAAQN